MEPIGIIDGLLASLMELLKLDLLTCVELPMGYILLNENGQIVGVVIKRGPNYLIFCTFMTQID